MAYTKQTWTNDVTAITAERMTHIENGIYDNSLATDKINPSGTATTTAEIEAGQVTDVIGFKSLKLKGQTSQYTTTGSQLFDIDNTPSANRQYVINNGFKLTKGTNRTIQISLPNPIPAGTYYISADVINSTLSGNNKINVSFKDANNTDVVANVTFLTNGAVTTTAEVKDLYFFIISSEADTATITLDNIMLNSGSTRKDFEKYTGGKASPNPDFPQDVENVSGDNVIEISNVNKLPYAQSGSHAVSGMTHSSNGKGIYTLNGTATANSRYDWEIEPYIIKQGDYLYLGNTATNSTVTVALLENASTQIMYTGPTAVNRIVSLNNYVGRTVTYIRTYTNAQTLNNFTLKPMICTTTSVSEFEEHKGNNFDIDLPIELCKIGAYADYIYKKDGKWWKHKAIEKINNRTNWTINSIGSNNRAVISLSTNNYANAVDQFRAINCFSNMFTSLTQEAITSTTAINTIAVNSQNMYIKFDDSINTKELAKAELDSMTNLEIYYALATPIEEEITYTPLIRQLDELYNSGLYDVTNISQDNSSEAFVLDFEACKNNINGIVEYIRR